MCVHGDIIEIEIVQKIQVDRCIAAEIKWLNQHGVRTEGCCCGHGRTKPAAMITPSSVTRAEQLGYQPIYCSDVGLFKILLRGG